MNRRLIAVVSSLVLATSLAACATGGSSSGDTSSPKSSTSAETTSSGSENSTETGSASSKVDTVTFNVERVDQGHEQATIKATFENGKDAWSVTTGQYPMAQLSSFTCIGSNSGRYYYVEAGTVVALDEQTGSIAWKNSDNVGAPADRCFAFGSDGTLYIAGYLSSEVVAIDSTGRTVERFAFDENNYWPYQMSIVDGETLVVTFEHSSAANQTQSFSI